MQDIQINDSITKTIVTLHDNRLDYFYATSDQIGYSFHVGHLKAIELMTDKNGKHMLLVKTDHRTNKDEVSAQALPRVRELVSAVLEAMKSFKP